MGTWALPVDRGPLGFALLAILVLMGWASHAIAESSEPDRLNARVDRLTRDLSILDAQLAQVSGGGTATASPTPGPAVARLEVRVAQLEQDLRALTGRVEDVSYRLQQINDRLDKLVADIDYRLTQVSQGGGGTGAVSEPPSASLPTASPGAESEPALGPAPKVLGKLPDAELKAQMPAPKSSPQVPADETPPREAAALLKGSPREQYAYAFDLLRKANYDQAEVGFSEFLKQHPDDPLADNARYWLGETYYVRGDYARAAEVFLDAYGKNKTGPKAADTLLKLGLSLSNLKKTREACATFQELNKSVPNVPQAVKDKANQERKRLNCP